MSSLKKSKAPTIPTLKLLKKIIMTTTPTQTEPSSLPLRDIVSKMIEQYIITMEDHHADNLHQMVIKEVEVGLFRKVLQLCHGNQSLAAKWLGLARGTLRKKLAEYKIN